MDCQSIAATEASNVGPRCRRRRECTSGWPTRSATSLGAASLLLGALPSAVPCARLHARQVLWEWGTV